MNLWIGSSRSYQIRDMEDTGYVSYQLQKQSKGS